jgi:hypothetical protein
VIRPDLYRRRVVSVVLASIVVAATAAGCGGDDAASTTSGGGSPSSSGIGDAKALAAELATERADTAIELPPLPEKPPEDKTLFVLTCAIPVCHVTNDNAVKAAEELGWNVREFSTDLTPEAYTKAWDQMLQAGKPDYIVYTPITPNEAIAEQLAQAEAQGTRMVIVAPASLYDVPGKDGAIATVPGPRLFEQTGATAATFALGDAGEPVAAVAVADPAFVATQAAMAKGFVDQMRKLCATCEPATLDVSLNAPATTNEQTIINHLQRNPDVRYVFLPLATYAPNLPRAMRSAGIEGVEVVVAQPSAGDMEKAMSGDYAAVIQNENVSAGWRIIDALARDAVGEGPGPNRDPVGYTRILTQDNITSTEPPATPGTPEKFLEAWQVNTVQDERR